MPAGLIGGYEVFAIYCDEEEAYLVKWGEEAERLIDVDIGEEAEHEFISGVQRIDESGRYAWLDRGKEVDRGMLVFDYHGEDGALRCALRGRDLSVARSGFSVLNGKDYPTVRIAVVVGSGEGRSLVVISGIDREIDVVSLSGGDSSIDVKCYLITTF